MFWYVVCGVVWCGVLVVVFVVAVLVVCVVACLLLLDGLSSDVETSFGYLQEGHGCSCHLSALV